jgi:16S rRNA (cytidine1402-2'-O)-methyltransferase
MPGTLFVVATPIGNLEDVTVRALRVLRDVSVIAAEDTRRTSHLLVRHGITTPSTSLHEHNEGKKAAALVARLLQGEDVALVSDAGTPTVSDPGARLIREAIDAGLRVEAIPGPSAVLTALVASGLPAETFCFLGFPPIRSKDRKTWFERLKQSDETVVFFEAPHRIRQTLEELLRTVGDCEVAVGRELTKKHECFVRGPITKALQLLTEPIGEFTVVARIGQIAETDRGLSPGPRELELEFGEMTGAGQLTRRRAVAMLARKHGLAPNLVYEMLEKIRKSVV